MSRQTYVIRDGQLVPKHLAAPRTETKGASFIPDIKPFVTQDGTEITSRSGLRAYEQKNGVKQVGTDWTGSAKPKWWDAYKSGEHRG